VGREFPSPTLAVVGVSAALEHVLWIGGAPGVGKTTVASILARRHGLRLYSADTRTWIHRDRAIAPGVPAAIRWERLAPADRLTGPDDELVAMSLYRERGAMVVADVAELPASPLIVAEGSVIRPADVPAGTAALWLAADRDAVKQRLGARDGRSNRLYELMVDVVAADVGAAHAPAIESVYLEATVSAVEDFFAEQLARGPLATGVDERRALLREANLDIVEQVRGFHARPWATGAPESVVRSFICECGGRECTVFVDASVGDAARAPVVSTAHLTAR
jgi:hypothetical protein